MFLLNDQPLALDVPFEHNEVQYPANWLRLASPEEREAIGITEAPDPPAYDQRFYWGYDADGALIPMDHTMLVERWTAQIRATAGTLLAPTDWMVIREADNGAAVDASVRQWRQDIRTASSEKIAAIEATSDTGELAAYVVSAAYSAWPSS